MFASHHERAVAADADAAQFQSPPSQDDLSPAQTGDKLTGWCEAKAAMPLDRMLVLGLLAGAAIAMGGAFFTAVMSGVDLGHGPSRITGGIAFSLGLVLVFGTGAELSTGNCLGFAPLMRGRMTPTALARLLAVTFAANILGALLIVALVVSTGLLDGAQGQVAVRIAEAKLALTPVQAYFRGVLGNALVCLAVWLILSARTNVGKLAGLVFPISAFVVLGLEHSIANAYLLPAGLLAGATGTWAAVALNLAAVTLGNLVGGMLVAATLWAGHLKATMGPGPAEGERAQVVTLAMHR